MSSEGTPLDLAKLEQSLETRYPELHDERVDWLVEYYVLMKSMDNQGIERDYRDNQSLQYRAAFYAQECGYKSPEAAAATRQAPSSYASTETSTDPQPSKSISET